MNRTRLTLAAFATIATVAGVVEASAQSRDRWGRTQPTYVVAESRFGHGTVRGATRLTANGGWQVQMPHGTWIDCRKSCADTLRIAALDFWENQGPNRIDNEEGIFGNLTINRWF